jgi:hypothetical protein
VIFLGVVGILSLVLYYISLYIKNTEIQDDETTHKGTSLSIFINFISLTIQYFLLFSFLQSDFLPGYLDQLQKMVFFGAVTYTLIINRQQKNKRSSVNQIEKGEHHEQQK